MKVSVDASRFLHLLALIALTVGGGQLLIRAFEWNGLTAYGTACTLVCQISNVLMKLWSGDLDDIIKNSSSEESTKKESNKERKNGKAGNPKKKRN